MGCGDERLVVEVMVVMKNGLFGRGMTAFLRNLDSGPSARAALHMAWRDDLAPDASADCELL